MNLRQLKYFVSVVEAGNMTRAAEQLHVAQTVARHANPAD
jgi:LysR family nitrogen assimilation transcriptional regulator